MFKTTSRYLAIAVASVALSIGAAGYAAAQQSQMPMQGGGHDGGHFMHHHHGHHMMEELNRVHGWLNLNASQEKLWQNAVDTMKQAHETEHATHEQMHQQMQAMQQQPILDMNALHAAHEKAERQHEQLREQTAKAWLTLYNSLNDQQKTIVSTVIKQHFAEMEARHERMQKMHQLWQQHHKDGQAQQQQQQQAPASAANQ
jgi:periplasmic protein CpxP/Spy